MKICLGNDGGKLMRKKLLTAILSAVIFSFLLSLISYLTYTSDNLWLPMGFIILYAAPVYVIGGIPFSYLIESFLKKRNFSSQLVRHYSKYGLYIVAGVIVAFIYIVIVSIMDDQFVILSQASLTYVIGGILAALVYYYVSLLTDRNSSN